MIEAEASEPVVLVVGGAGSIGRAVCQELHSRGVETLSWDPAHDELEKTPWLVEKRSILDCDSVSVPLSVQHVINCSGGPVEDEFLTSELPDLATFRRCMETNVYTSYACVELLAHQTQREGCDRSVTLLSSVNESGRYGLPAYSAAKGGVLALARALRPSVLGLGVRLNCVVLGTVRSASWERNWQLGTALPPQTALYPETPTGRLLSPEAAARLIVMTALTTELVASDIVVDNGQASC